MARQVYYGDVIMVAIASQITSLPIVYLTVYSGEDQRKHQSSASLAMTSSWQILPFPTLSMPWLRRHHQSWILTLCTQFVFGWTIYPGSTVHTNNIMQIYRWGRHQVIKSNSRLNFGNVRVRSDFIIRRGHKYCHNIRLMVNHQSWYWPCAHSSSLVGRYIQEVLFTQTILCRYIGGDVIKSSSLTVG